MHVGFSLDRFFEVANDVVVVVAEARI